MERGIELCRHQLRHSLPELVTNAEGTKYLVFECLPCGCMVILRLNREGEVDEETVIPPARKLA